VLTPWQVVSGQRTGKELVIFTSDGRGHQLEPGSIRRLGLADVATVSFSSSTAYKVALVCNVPSLSTGRPFFVGIIMSSVAIVLSCTSFWISRMKATKRSVETLRSRFYDLHQSLNQVLEGVSPTRERAELEISKPQQAWAVSDEISMLKTVVEHIRRDLQINHETLSNHSHAISELQNAQDTLSALATKVVEHKDESLNAIRALDVPPEESGSEDTLFPSLNASTGLKSVIAQSGGTERVFIEQPLAEPTEAYQIVCQKYQSAIDQGDRQALRQLQLKELNITSACEDLLVRGNTEQPTKLEAVLGGGSYVVISGEQRYWLFPTAQTLDGFSMNQPLKGIFSYKQEFISRPMVKLPAEVREDGETWVVVAKGIVAIPS